MKLVKSLLLGSAAGLLAVASSQAADLPYRKAAPVEYVKICDAHGAGFWYIPGTDTCLHVGGNVTFEYRVQDVKRQFPYTFNPAGTVTANGRPTRAYAFGAPVSIRSRDSTGSYARGRVQLDARNTTAYGTLRTFISLDMNHKTGVYGVNGDNVDIDKAFIQWAGLTAGRYQSVFDFYADDWNNEAIRNSDSDVNGIAYTYTFGGGFTATISVEDHNDRLAAAPPGAGFPNTGPYGSDPRGGSVIAGGYRSPDLVGQLDWTQTWGDIRVTGAAHQENTVFSPLIALDGTDTFGDQTKWGFAVLGGVMFNLPTLAAGDQLWIEGEYTSGALAYQQVSNGNRNFTGNGLLQPDYDAVWARVANAGSPTGFSDKLTLPTAWSVMAAGQHYFTPQLIGRLFGSYIDVKYNSAVTSELITSNWNEYRIGGQLYWEQIYGGKPFDIGVEAMYARLNQKIPAGGTPFAALVGGLPANKNVDGFEGRIHIERDF
ncbi:MAG: porin [Methylobacteriaceae bacterium]|nr:porin [Methylobacteriaceae bacterium]MBV9636938.1 porin [Methylobacteriaceae bacterium]MBV9702317.1 porin [Methylobacteriaceae bacterium]